MLIGLETENGFATFEMVGNPEAEFILAFRKALSEACQHLLQQRGDPIEPILWSDVGSRAIESLMQQGWVAKRAWDFEFPGWPVCVFRGPLPDAMRDTCSIIGEYQEIIAAHNALAMRPETRRPPFPWHLLLPPAATALGLTILSLLGVVKPVAIAAGFGFLLLVGAAVLWSTREKA